MDDRKLDRFSGRGSFYARYRPGYANDVIHILRQHAGWTPEAVVADIGAGTGISSELFLRNGNTVWAVEPNADMLRHAIARLKDIAYQFDARRASPVSSNGTVALSAAQRLADLRTKLCWLPAKRATTAALLAMLIGH